ncbi:GlxA family transcriptional regulator [Jannaschia pohangensis]|uniref:Transcriptional regulator, AraC family with amidase-like domain n=1 Tax=Jannaschia pohangensis TaxID=390807 RepID=A0A1I3IX45_9RHOB|nr:helix-turn-helix domain-containing protein [Jannaschia pohangensis]SFI52425.1 transcriptional regulator, AraC family with amidase-like domain [Jannaschia pohangensis]
MTNHLQNLPNASVSIAILAYEGVQMSAVLGLEDLFLIANRHAARTGSVLLRVETLAADQLRGTFAVVIVPPNLSGARGDGDAQVHAFLRAEHRAGATICSACAGIFWLAGAGLLRGREVTTHWALEAEFAARCPEAALQTDRILIDDDDIVTAGGMMAWIDLGLFVVERFGGPEAMTFVARHLLVDPRGRQQSNYRTFRPAVAHDDAAVLTLQHWMEGHVDADLSVRALALRAGCSERTFIRRFKAATGLPPNRYVQTLRIETARSLLEQSGRTIQDIGWSVGYQDISAFGRVFKSVTGTTPGDYRTRFGLAAPR